jgi:hypothetical protein
MLIQTHADDIVTVENFIEKKACAQLIERAETIGFDEADVQLPEGSKKVKSIRDNMRCRFTDTALAESLYQQSQIFMPEYLLDAKIYALNDLFRCYKYEPGQRFKMHRDGVFKKSEREHSAFTWMVYLNDDFQGGYTCFKNGVLIEPKQGMLLVFPHELKHEGSEVSVGEKYVLRSDVMYKQLSEGDGIYESMAHNFNTTFCEVVAETFDSFFAALNYEVVQNERAAWVADYKYKNYELNRSVLFKYSGYPDGFAYYEIILQSPVKRVVLEQLCAKLHPAYNANQDQLTMLIRNDYRQLVRNDFGDRMKRHFWEMKLLCMDALTGVVDL